MSLPCVEDLVQILADLVGLREFGWCCFGETQLNLLEYRCAATPHQNHICRVV